VIVRETNNNHQTETTPLSQTRQPNYGSQDLAGTTPVEPGANTNLVRRSLLFVFGSLKSVVKPRPGWRRVIVLLGVFNFMCYIFTYNGTEGTHRYYFAQAKYGWTEQEMSTYLFDYRLGYMLSLWILVPFMTNWLAFSDNTIAIMACLLSATGYILPAVTGTQVFLDVRNDFLGHLVINWFSVGSFFCLLSPVTTITTRSVISRAISDQAWVDVRPNSSSLINI